MKYPLKWYHSAGRELICFFLGHNWKSSWRKRSDYNIIRSLSIKEYDKQISYSRRQSGNSMFEFSEGWKNKCKRCRERTRNEFQWFPWWKDLYNAIRNGVHAVETNYFFFKEDFKDTRTKSVFYFLLSTPIDMLSAFYLYLLLEWHLPWFIQQALFEIEDKILNLIYKDQES